MPKNKKKNKKQAPISDNDDDFGDGNDFEIMNDLSKNKKKKKKKKKKKGKAAPISSEDELNIDEPKNEPTNDWNDNSSDEEIPKPEPPKQQKKKKKKKKKKKGKNAPISSDDEPEIVKDTNTNDWNDNSEDDVEPEIPKNLSKKQKKKKKKKKKKGKGAPISSDEEFGETQTPAETPKNDWNDESEEDIKPKNVGKKQKKKNKKKKKGKGAQISDEETPKNEWNDESDDDFSQNKKKQKKKKKKKNKKNKQLQISDEETPKNEFDNESDDNNYGKKKNKKKKKKKKNKQKKQPKKPEKTREEILAELKEQKQEKLLIYGNSKMENLEMQYAKYFTDDKKLLWEDALGEVVTTFGEDEDDIESKEAYDASIAMLDEYWDTILVEMQNDMEENREKMASERKEKERQERIEQFKRMGMSVGGGGGGNKRRGGGGGGKKKGKRKPDKNRLAELRKRLAEADKMAAEKEKEEEIKRKKEKELREKEALKKKEEERIRSEKMSAKNWDASSDSDSDSSTNENTKKKPVKKPQKPKKKNKQNKIDDDSDDAGRYVNKKKRKRRKKKIVTPAVAQKNEEKKEETKEEKEVPKEEIKEKEKTALELEMEKYEKLTKNDLKKICRNFGISVGGKKTDLLDRLKNDFIRKERENNIKQHARGGAGNNIDNKGDNKSPKKDKKDKKKKRIIRSPICVVMGHVDTGKTKILDYIRKSKVQSNEVGGITQQIGATFLSKDYIKKCTVRLKEQVSKIKLKVPGLLFIDTPGHESFANLRARGSSMCDIAILVVDIMHYLEPQTIESIKLLQKRKAPYIVALNKIDRCYDWKPDENAPFEISFKKQKKHTKQDFEQRLDKTKLEFAKIGINSELYMRNKNLKSDVSLVPTSAHTGEGIPDLLYLLCQLTQNFMKKKLQFEESKFKASVLEVKQVEGYGSTIDVILSNGTLHPSDTIVVCGMRGPICSKIRALLLPDEASEMRVKGGYKVLQEPINASMGVRIACQDSLDYALAGSELCVVPRHLKGNDRYECIEQLKDAVQGDYAKILSKVDRHNKGVYVQASTLGSLEALITFLSALKPAIPISGIGIGNVHKADVVRASTCVQTQPEYAVILAFNIKIDAEARQLAEQTGVRIFEAEIIYHLQEKFEKYVTELREKRKEQAKDVAVFPVEMFILSPEHVFHNKNPFVLGVEIKKGNLRINTPIVAQRYNSSKAPVPVFLGRVTSIRKEDKEVKMANKGDKVSVRIEGDDTTKNIQAGRNFALKDPLISRISDESIKALKQHFADEVRDNKEMVKHLFFLKDYFGII